MQQLFQDHASGGIVIAKIADHALIDLDDDSLSDEIFADHVGQVFAFNVLGNRALQQVFGVEVRLAAELLDSLGQHIGVLAFCVSMVLELAGHSFTVDAGGHEVMVNIAQQANDFSSKRFIEDLNGFFDVPLVTLRDGAVFHFFFRAPPKVFNIFYEMWHEYSPSEKSATSNKGKIVATRRKMPAVLSVAGEQERWSG